MIRIITRLRQERMQVNNTMVDAVIVSTWIDLTLVRDDCLVHFTSWQWKADHIHYYIRHIAFLGCSEMRTLWGEQNRAIRRGQKLMLID